MTIQTSFGAFSDVKEKGPSAPTEGPSIRVAPKEAARPGKKVSRSVSVSTAVGQKTRLSDNIYYVDKRASARANTAYGAGETQLTIVPDPQPVRVPNGPQECVPELYVRQDRLADALEAAGLTKRATRHRNCNRKWNQWGCGNCGADSYAAVETCDLRVCVSCQRRQAKEIAAKVHQRIAGVKKRRGYRLRLITVTVRTSGPKGMGKAIQKIGKALPKFYRKCLKAKDAGAVFALEAGEENGNIHAHGLYWGPYIEQATLSAEWQKLTGDPVVDIRAARGPKAVAEVCKYICSPTLPIPMQVQLEKALRGTRRIRTYGAFYGVEPVKQEERECRRRCPHCKHIGQLELTGTITVPRATCRPYS